MLATHADILEVAVVAIADETWGERPKAYVTAKEGRVVDGKQVIEWAKHKSSISKFMVPAEVEVLDELPKTSTGKTKKVELREMARRSKKGT
jgi:acyl-coenzyme A synthetase/AMP-(fatty) acid ligase